MGKLSQVMFKILCICLRCNAMAQFMGLVGNVLSTNVDTNGKHFTFLATLSAIIVFIATIDLLELFNTHVIGGTVSY